nr:PREDICTED: disintegrin and metalloproteinase domain-containing protein 11 [Rhinolophus sinicus]
MVVPVTLERAGRVQLDWMGWMFKGEGNLFGSFCWPVHLAQVSFVIPAFNTNFTLDLELNHHLLSSQYVERHFSREGRTQHSTGAGDHCYYQGKLRGNPRSFAALSTCQGLHGVFSDGTFTYIVEPREMTGPRKAPQGPLPHLIYRTPLLPAPLGCREPGCLFTAPIHPALNRPRLRKKRQVRGPHRPRAAETSGCGPEQEDTPIHGWGKGRLFWRDVDIFVLHLPHPKYDNMGAMAVTLAQTLGQNLGMMWNKHRSSAGDCKCPDNWLGCIMEDTGFYLPRKFSRCSIDEYNQFLQEGGGSCLFNKPLKLLDPPECGNGFVEAGEECDCGSVQECNRAGGNCCKKCTLTHDAMCSDGLCCRRCKYEPRGVSCREAVNECDIAETCTGDSSQCPPNLHKLDGYYCDHEQGRCYGGRCKTRDRQCQALWGHVAADRFCYEKLNVEGTERGNCGRKGSGWVQCNKQDVLCGFLLCVNISGAPRLGDLGGDISSVTFYHQGKELDCRGGHVQLADGSDLSYVEDGTACGPNMLCLDHRCLPASAFNFSTCPGSGERRICSHHGVCSNEGKCICQPDWTGKDCSIHNPLPTSLPTGETEKYKGPSGTNIIIGSIAGAVLVAAIVLGGTGWGFKNIRRGRSGGA